MWKSVGYYNGEMGPLEEMKVPMGDRALYFGDGIYEATCVANRVPFALDEHLDRMYNSLRLLEIPFRMERDQVKAELQKVIDAAEESPVYFLYWQISRGVCVRNHPFPPAEVQPTLLIYVRPYAMKSLDKPYKLISLEDNRYKLCNIKTLNLIPSVLANQRAVERGCDEAVLHRGSRVTECAHSNISILKDGVLRTAPTDELILPGITRKHLLELARANGIPVEEKPFSMVELMNADEAIVTSSSALCMSVESIDGIPVGGKDRTHLKQLQQAYLEKFQRETQKA
jgi:D-alanine transaminase